MSRISFDASHPSMHPSSPPSPQRKQFIPISPDRHKPKTILERAALLAPPTLSLNQTTTDTTHRNLSNPSTPTKLNNINDNSTPTTDPRKFSVTNLDTGESFRIDHVPSTQAVEAQLDTFLNSEQEELIEAALQENDSNPNSEERKMNASPLAALYTKNETQMMNDIVNREEGDVEDGRDSNDSWLNSETNPLSDDEEDQEIAEHRSNRFNGQHNNNQVDPVRLFAKQLANAKSPHRSTRSKVIGTTTTTSTGLLSAASPKRSRTSSGQGVATLPRVTIEGNGLARDENGKLHTVYRLRVQERDARKIKPSSANRRGNSKRLLQPVGKCYSLKFFYIIFSRIEYLTVRRKNYFTIF